MRISMAETDTSVIDLKLTHSLWFEIWRPCIRPSLHGMVKRSQTPESSFRDGTCRNKYNRSNAADLPFLCALLERLVLTYCNAGERAI